MKKNLFILLLVCSCNIIFAQENGYKNTLKWVASSQVLGRTQLAYERALGQRISLGLGFGINSTGGVLIKGISGDNFYLSGFNYDSGFLTNLEIRYYFKNTSIDKKMAGFHLGLYTSYYERKGSTDGWYLDNDNNKSSYELNVGLTSYVVGIQAGYKLKVYKRWNLDFIILGPGYSFNQINLNFDTTINQKTIDAIRQTINDRFSFLGDKLPEFVIDPNDNTTYKSNFSLPAFRYGIGVGYSF